MHRTRGKETKYGFSVMFFVCCSFGAFCWQMCSCTVFFLYSLARYNRSINNNYNGFDIQNKSLQIYKYRILIRKGNLINSINFRSLIFDESNRKCYYTIIPFK